MLPETVCGDEALQVSPQVPVTHDNPPSLWHSGADQRECADDHVVPLLAIFQGSDSDQLGHVGDRHGLSGRKIDARMDQVDPRLRGTSDTCERLRVPTDRNHGLRVSRGEPGQSRPSRRLESIQILDYRDAGETAQSLRRGASDDVRAQDHVRLLLNPEHKAAQVQPNDGTWPALARADSPYGEA